MNLFSPEPGRIIRLWLSSLRLRFFLTLSHKESHSTKHILFIRTKHIVISLVVCDRLLIVAAVGPESMPYPDYQPLFLKIFIFFQRIHRCKNVVVELDWDSSRESWLRTGMRRSPRANDYVDLPPASEPKFVSCRCLPRKECGNRSLWTIHTH